MASMVEKKGMLQSFKEFIARPNVLELAVAIVLGIAFGAVVLAFVDGIIMPLIAAIVGEPNFDALTLSVGDGLVLYGTFLTALVNFLLIGAALFMVVKGIERMQRPKVVDVTDEEPAEDVELLREIRDLLAQGAQMPGR